MFNKNGEAPFIVTRERQETMSSQDRNKPQNNDKQGFSRFRITFILSSSKGEHS